MYRANATEGTDNTKSAVGRTNPSRPSSYVPDHIKHPERYTTYVLEEPILVGGGNDGSQTASQTDQLRVRHWPGFLVWHFWNFYIYFWGMSTG